VKLVSDYDQKTTTHVLCSKVVFKGGEAKGSRTLKYMLGVVGGQWVLAWDCKLLPFRYHVALLVLNIISL
jgi:hypothetical protein